MLSSGDIRAGMTLVWDVDDVLNALTREWFMREWLPRHPTGPVRRYEQLTANPPCELLGVPRQDYLDSLDAFRADAYFTLQPDAGIRAWMERDGHRFRHIALSAVPLAAAAYSGEWIYRHWGRWIRTIHIVPSSRRNCDAPVWDRTKAGFLRWLNQKDAVLIEDNPLACKEAQDAGYRALIVPQPWNAGGAGWVTLDTLTGGEFGSENGESPC